MIAVTTPLIWLSIVSGITLSLTPSPSATVTAVSTGAAPVVNGIDPAILAAWITAAGAVIVALIAGGFTIYQVRRSARQNEQIDSPVRGCIADTLGKLGENMVVPELLEMLPDEQIDFSVRKSIANALGKLGEKTVAPELLQMLPNEQIDFYVRESIANALGKLGEKTIANELVQMLPNKQIDSSVRKGIAIALTSLLNDERSVRDLAAILLESDIADAIHRLLWTISRQVGVRIFMNDGSGGRRLDVVKPGGTDR